MDQKKITVLGIGGSGCRIVGILKENPLAAPLRLIAIDSDVAGLEACGLEESCRLLAGERWRNGRGCGGNVIDGQRVVAHERTHIEKLLDGVSFLLVVFTRPFAMKYINARHERTNVDELIGKLVKVTETVDNYEQTGAATANGLDWTARSEDDRETIEKGSLARVVRISGVKLILKKSEEGKS